MARYCIKCFDDRGDLALSIVTDRDDLFDIVNNFKGLYKVKAYILTDNVESEEI